MKTKTQKICMIINCICFVVLIITGLLFYQIFSGTATNENNGFVWEIYDFYSESYQSNPLILNVSNFCSQFDNKVECVFYNVPYIYHNHDGFFVTPEEFWSTGGVCRDISIMRKSVMNNLNISCAYIFSPTHVYLVCSENGNTYTLNHKFERGSK